MTSQTDRQTDRQTNRGTWLNVGLTTRSDYEINTWTAGWLRKNPEYEALNDNCQKFAYEFIAWLTGGVFTIPHR